MTEDKNKDIQIYLMALIKSVVSDKEWRHTETQVLADGRVIIHLKIEKKRNE